MRAVQLTGFGGPEQLALADVPAPTPGPGQVAVRVRSASVNRSDVLLRSGRYHTLPALPVVPGNEAAGDVVAVGPGVTGLQPGDRVVAWGSGFYAEQAVADATRVVTLPASVPFDVASALPVAWSTARHSVRELAAVRDGQTLLLTAAASGVGTAALQLAAAAGARVIAVVGSEAKADAVRRLGAAAVIDRHRGAIAKEALELTDGAGVDAAIDLTGGPTFRELLVATRAGGRVVSVANVALEPTEIDVRDFYPKNLTIFGFQFTNRQQLGWDPRPGLAEVLEEIAAGRLEVPIDSRWPLEQAPDAHRRLESAATIGKVLLTT